MLNPDTDLLLCSASVLFMLALPLASSSMTSPMFVPKIVDDSSLDLIRYIDPAPNPNGEYTYRWVHETSDDGVLSPFNNRTISYCLQPGAMALFTFHGKLLYSIFKRKLTYTRDLR